MSMHTTENKKNKALTSLDFLAFKQRSEKISMTTVYDAWSARLLAETKIDAVLVGDSLAMVMHGHSSTLAATTDVMALHVAAVARTLPNKMIIADMPFLSFRKTRVDALNAVDALMKAGAHAVKLEGVRGHEEIIKHIVQSGVPVMGHLGLTPQSVHHLGGMKVQAREEAEADCLFSDAVLLEELGSFSLVLECVPSSLASRVSKRLHIPTIGIGAGAECDGQVLVLQDLLGLSLGFKPKFLKTYLNGAEQIIHAIDQYSSEVKHGGFPTAEQSYK